jgi:hypothetical protein
VYRYLREGLELLAAMAPTLQQAIAVAQRKAFVILDGTLLRIDQVGMAYGVSFQESAPSGPTRGCRFRRTSGSRNDRTGDSTTLNDKMPSPGGRSRRWGPPWCCQSQW